MVEPNAKAGNRDVLVTIRTAKPTRDALHLMARADGLSLSAWLRRLAVRRVSELDAAGVRPKRSAEAGVG